jgi:hypothetical protein
MLDIGVIGAILIAMSPKMDIEPENIICKCVAGSKMYGLDTPESDTDIRGIFLNRDLNTIIGFGKHEHQDLRGGGKDKFMWEFRKYLYSLKRANTQSIELLFNSDWIKITPLFQLVQSHKHRLLDLERLFVSLTGGDKCKRTRGYIGNEMRLAFGDRTGKLGKRKEALALYGFSPKNVVQILRLAYCGRRLFETGAFPIKISTGAPELEHLLLNIKTCPEQWEKQALIDLVNEYRGRLNKAYDNCKLNYVFDSTLADELCLFAYKEFLTNYIPSLLPNK